MNKQKEKCVIMIPVHKQHPPAYELISFRQCFKVLGHYPVCLVAPVGLDLSVYEEAVSGFSIIRVDPVWMSSVLNYNKLKLSRYFYSLFSGYEFLLTYELDAFIFTDNLQFWCSQGYDFIGAPWFEGWDHPGEALMGVGNSGFSLRRIAAMQKELGTIYYDDPSKWTARSENRYLSYPCKMFKSLTTRIVSALSLHTHENSSLQNADLLYEDWIIAELMGKKKDFHLSPISDAMQFSFEVKPEALFELNGNKLPMGCHAWWRYNLPFWKPYIEKFGYQL